MSELKEGWFNAAYNVRLSDGREVILKIAPGRRMLKFWRMRRISWRPRLPLCAWCVENPAIPVPEIYSFDTARDVCDSDYFFMEKLTGTNYEHVKESFSPAMQAQIDQQIGAIVREINGFTGTYFGYDGNSDLRGETVKEEAFIKIMDLVLEDGSRKHADFGSTIDEIRGAVLKKHALSLGAVTTPRLVDWDAGDSGNFFVKDGKVTGTSNPRGRSGPTP